MFSFFHLRNFLPLLISILPFQAVSAFIDYPYAVTFQTIRLPLLPLDEDVSLENGSRWSLRLSSQWINVWSLQSNRFHIDGEEFDINPSLRYRFEDDSVFGVSLPVKSVGGGIMDDYIEGFHDAANVTQGQRDRYPRNKFNVSYEPFAEFYPLLDGDPLFTYMRQFDLRLYPRDRLDPPIKNISNQTLTLLSEEIVNKSGDRANIGDPRIYYQKELWSGRRFIDRIHGGIQLKVPVYTDQLLGSPGLDTGLFLVLGKKDFIPDLSWRLGISYTHFEMVKFLSLSLPDHQWVFRPALDYTLDSEWSLSLEYLYFSAPVKHFGRLSKPGHQVSFVLMRKSENHKLVYAVVENFGNYGVTPDIGFHFSIETLQ